MHLMRKHKMNKYIIRSTYTLYFNASGKKQMNLSNTYHAIIKQTTSFTFIRILETGKQALKYNNCVLVFTFCPSAPNPPCCISFKRPGLGLFKPSFSLDSWFLISFYHEEGRTDYFFLKPQPPVVLLLPEPALLFPFILTFFIFKFKIQSWLLLLKYFSILLNYYPISNSRQLVATATGSGMVMWPKPGQ